MCNNISTSSALFATVHFCTCAPLHYHLSGYHQWHCNRMNLVLLGRWEACRYREKAGAESPDLSMSLRIFQGSQMMLGIFSFGTARHFMQLQGFVLLLKRQEKRHGFTVASLFPLKVVGDAVGWGFVVRGSKPCHVQAVDPSGPAAAAGMKVTLMIASRRF